MTFGSKHICVQYYLIGAMVCASIWASKSGDASTFLGNTIYTMSVMAYLYDMRHLVLGMFAGNDNLCFGIMPYKDKSELCAKAFNLESKFLNNYRYSYFCSKFLFKANGHTNFVPDPMKMIKKLGRSDLRDGQHAEEYRRSLADLCRPLGDSLIYTELSIAVCERYGSAPRDLSTEFASLYTIVNTPELFHELYYSNPGDVLLSDPSRPKL